MSHAARVELVWGMGGAGVGHGEANGEGACCADGAPQAAVDEEHVSPLTSPILKNG